MAVPKGKEWAEGFQKGGEAAGKAAFDLITHFAQMKIPEKLLKDYSPGSPIYNSVWEGYYQDRRSLQRAGPFHGPDRLRMDVGPQRLQSASQRNPA